MQLIISYRDILKNAWKNTWKNKRLWILGVLASFIPLETAYLILLSQINQAQNISDLQQTILNLSAEQTALIYGQIRIFNLFLTDFWGYIAFIFAITAIAVFIWLVFASQIALIKNNALLYKNKKLPLLRITFGQSCSQVGPVVIIYILARLAVYAGFIGLSLPLLYALISKNVGLIFTANFFFLVAFTVFSMIVNFLAAYAINFRILKEFNVFESIKFAWQIFSKNILISLEIAFILFAIKILSLILIFSLFFLACIPLAILFLIALYYNYNFGVIALVVLALIIFSIISLLVNAVYTVFYLNCWTITFIKISEESLWGKIFGFVKSVPGRVAKAISSSKDALRIKRVKAARKRKKARV